MKSKTRKTWDETVVVLLAAVMLFLAARYTVLKPIEAENEELTERSVKYEQDFIRGKAIRKQWDRFEVEYAALEDQHGKLDLIFIPQSEFETALEFIMNQAKEADIHLSKHGTAREVDKEFYVEMTVTLAAQGTQDNLIRFLESMERLRVLARVTHLEWEPEAFLLSGRSSKKSLDLKLSITIVCQRDFD
ncbi:type 4a pilus biogenesis protein PilO [Acidobacteriota bacterium]